MTLRISQGQSRHAVTLLEMMYDIELFQYTCTARTGVRHTRTVALLCAGARGGGARTPERGELRAAPAGRGTERESWLAGERAAG